MAEMTTGGKRKNDRKYPGYKGRRPDFGKMRQEEAAERQAAYDQLSTAEKLARLDEKLGKDIGAKKQRAKLVVAEK